MKQALLILFILLSLPVKADIAQDSAKGFHWYSREQEKIEKKKVLPQPRMAEKSPYEKLLEQRRQTLNKLATALVEPSFDATHEYMKAQMVYAKNNQKFVRFWQQVLLTHPELDNTLNFPTDNSAVAIRNDSTNLLMDRVVKEGAKKYGLILFYRGNSSISQKFVNVLMPFAMENQFSMISVSTDGQPIEGLPNPKSIPLEAVQKSITIESKYMPALFLVDLQTQKMSPLSYGFVSQMELKERFLDVTTNFKRFSYEGLGE